MSKELTPLQALNDLIDYLELEHYTLSEDEGVVERKQIIETALQALEIIKEKRVNVANFIYWLKREPRIYIDYLRDCYQEGWYLHYKDNNDDRCKFYELIQAEFDLLKEVLL